MDGDDDQYRRHADATDVDDERVSEWEAGLPDIDDLTPLSQSLIPRDLATAFSISPEPYRTLNDVTRASDNTISALRASNSVSSFQPNNSNKSRALLPVDTTTMMLVDEDADPRKSRRMDTTEEADSALRTDNSADDQSSARALKRPRLVWTPQLHKRFVDSEAQTVISKNSLTSGQTVFGDNGSSLNSLNYKPFWEITVWFKTPRWRHVVYSSC